MGLLEDLNPEILHDLSPYEDITVISFCSTPIHIATSLEIIQNNLQKRWQYVYWGNRTYFRNGMNLEYRRFRSQFPKEIENYFVSRNLSVKCTTDFSFDSASVLAQFKEINALVEKCNNVEDLREIDEILPSVGAALANAYVQVIRDKYSNISWNKILLKRLLYSYLETYHATLKLISSKAIDLVLIYNGRYLHERAVRDACLMNKIRVVMHETTRDKYFLRLEGFHDRVANQKLWSDFWNESTLSVHDRISIANEYFEGLQSKVSPFFTGTKLNDLSAESNKYVVFFTSNDDETIGFWDIWKEKLGNQFEVIDKLRELFAEQQELSLIIRVHPNTNNKPWQVRRKWSKEKASSNVTVIPASSKESSIELVKNSVGVMTFGSTIGLESIFLGKKVAVLCDSSYDNLDSVSKCDDWKSVKMWLQSLRSYESVTEEARVQACKRAYFVSRAGIPFQHFEVLLTRWNSWNPSRNSDSPLFARSKFTLFWKIWQKIVISIFRWWHVANLYGQNKAKV